MPLHLSTDPDQICREIDQLVELGYPVKRMTQHQIKIGSYKYYPGRGTITKDPGVRLEEQGFASLLELLKPEKQAR